MMLKWMAQRRSIVSRSSFSQIDRWSIDNRSTVGRLKFLFNFAIEGATIFDKFSIYLLLIQKVSNKPLLKILFIQIIY